MMRWTDPIWRDAALAWADEQVVRLGHRVTGSPDQFHVRPWSTVIRIPTTDGDTYLKAVPEALAHEIGLTSWLAANFPDRVLPVLAADVSRGLMLLPDGGPRLREAPTDLRGWERLVAEYAELQLLVAPHVDELLALGVPDRRLSRLPDALAAVLPAGDEAVVRYRELCARLAALGLPETLQMDDLHDGNVFVQGDRRRVFDWGDASISHPFACLEMILATFAETWEVDRDAPAVERVREAYLEPFRALATPGVLRRAAALAGRVVPTVRILAWQLAHHGAPPEEITGAWGETLPELIEAQLAALREGRDGAR